MPVTIDKGAPLRVVQKLVDYAKTITLTTAGGISLAREQIILAGEVSLLFGGVLAMDALLEQCRVYAEQDPTYRGAYQMIESTWCGHIPEWEKAHKKSG